MKYLITLLIAFMLSSCVEAPTKTTGNYAPVSLQIVVVTQKAAPPSELHWFRNSAERHAAYEQTYRVAASAVRLAVISDISLKEEGPTEAFIKANLVTQW